MDRQRMNSVGTDSVRFSIFVARGGLREAGCRNPGNSTSDTEYEDAKQL
jgi:hypothetical protein